MDDHSLVKINLIAFSIGAIGSFIMLFLPVFLSEQGLSGLEIGVLIGVGMITALFASIPVGIISDRFSIRVAFAFSIIMIFAFFVGLNFTTSFLAFFIVFLLLGLGKDTCNRFLEIFTLKVESKKNGKKFGKFNFSRYAGSAVGALLGGVSISILAFSLTLNILALLLLLLLIPIYFLKDVPTTKINIFQYRKDFFKIRTLLFAGLLFLFTFHWGAEHTSLGLFLKHYLGLNAALSGLYMSIPIFFLGLFSFIGGKLIDRKFDYKKIFIAGVLISGIGHIMMVTPDVYVSFFWRIIHEIGDGLFFVTQLIWVSLLFERQRIGGNYGIIFTIMTLGAFSGAVICGPLGDAAGYGLPLMISGAILVIEALILAAYIFRKKLKLVGTALDGV